MCNACGLQCCASDVFEKCGCDHCTNSACWDIEEDDYADCAPRVVSHQNNPLSEILREALAKNSK
jgi:hypothetical protein